MLADPVNEWLWDMRVSFSGSVVGFAAQTTGKPPILPGSKTLKENAAWI